MVLFEVNLAPREKKPVQRNIYIRKRANTTRINKELQEFAFDFELNPWMQSGTCFNKGLLA